MSSLSNQVLFRKHPTNPTHQQRLEPVRVTVRVLPERVIVNFDAGSCKAETEFFAKLRAAYPNQVHYSSVEGWVISGRRARETALHSLSNKYSFELIELPVTDEKRLDDLRRGAR